MSLPKNSINLVYIRAAIEAATGVLLSLEDVRRYLIEEGLITKKQAREEAAIFRGYSEFYDYDYSDVKKEANPPQELDFQKDEDIV
jgi:hypothetical protein